MLVEPVTRPIAHKLKLVAAPISIPPATEATGVNAADMLISSAVLDNIFGPDAVSAIMIALFDSSSFIVVFGAVGLPQSFWNQLIPSPASARLRSQSPAHQDQVFPSFD